MAKFPALPATVDRYVREFLYKLIGRSGNAGDRAVLHSDLAELGLAKEKGQNLSLPATSVSSITDTLEPVNPLELPDNPTTPEALSAAGIMGAIILQWQPAQYQGHNHTEVWRAQINDREQASLVHEANGSRYTDVTGNATTYYYWVRHVNDNGQVGGYNLLNGISATAQAGTEHIQEQVKGAVDKSWFTPGWASHTDNQDSLLSEAHSRIDSETTRRINDISLLASDLGNEATTRAAVDTTLGNRIDTVVADLSTETVNRTAAIQSELTARVNADTELNGKILAEAGRINTLVADLSTESSTRQAAIITVQQAMVDGDNALASDINSLTTTVNQNTASITTQQTVTDGLKAEYTLKVRQESNGQTTVAGIGVASGQAEDGETFSEISFAAENFFFTTPGGTAQPFVIANMGTEAVPDYKIMLDADVLINGSVSINQLDSGELKNGTALTVGQGSIELSTASDGYGQIVITGSGGITTNDYLVLKQGRIESFVYTESAGHVRYKEVRRTESGTASSGQQVVIPAYFKSQPSIHLTPRNMPIYNANYASQSQRVELEHSAVQPHPTTEGAWVFTPQCRLLLDEGTSTEAVGLTYTGSTNTQRWEVTGIEDLKQVTVNTRVASSRHSGSGNTYQNRQVMVKLEYRTGGGSWISGGTTTANINQFNTQSLQLSKSLSQATYDIAVTFTAADRSGTFTSGALEYDYTQAGKTGTGFNFDSQSLAFGAHGTKYQTVTIANPALSGWEITRVDYQYALDIELWVRCRSRSNLGTPFTDRNRPGLARVIVPNGQTFELETTYNNWQNENHSMTVNGTITSSFSSNLSPAIEYYLSRNGYDSGGDEERTSVIKLNVSNITATVYYRKAKTQSGTASNSFYWDSSQYDLGATDISLDNAVIHWTATGE